MKGKNVLMFFCKSIKLQKEYSADFYCFNKIIVELKALSALILDHESQHLNYLTATKTKVGLLINI